MSATAEDTLAKLNFGTVPSLTETPVEAKVVAAVEAGEEPKLTEEEMASLYAEAAELKVAQEAITERLEAIKAVYRRLDYGSTVVNKEAQGSVLIGHNPVFNEARFLVDYPYDEVNIVKEVIQDAEGNDRIVESTVYPNRELYVIKPDRPGIKKIFTEDSYKALFDEGAKKVQIK